MESKSLEEIKGDIAKIAEAALADHADLFNQVHRDLTEKLQEIENS
jgi:hypothetical protein